MEFKKQEGTSFFVEARPFRPKPGGAPDEKEYLPADFSETPPQWAATPIQFEGTDYPLMLEPIAGTAKCKITLPSLPDNATAPSSCEVTCILDAKRGEGVVPLPRTFTVTVLPEEPTDTEFVEVDG